MTKHLESYRRYFKITERYAYLDNALTSPISTRVSGAIHKFLKERSLQTDLVSNNWKDAVETTRELAARLIGTRAENVALLSHTSDGINTVAMGTRWKSGDSIITTDLEFPSNLYPWLHLQRYGVKVKIVKHQKDGTITLDQIRNRIDSKTRMIAISHVQYSNGFKIDLKELFEIAEQEQILLSVDAIQSVGALKVDSSWCDYLSAGGHKWLLAPFGVAIFYVKSPSALEPPFVGWKSVEDYSSYLTLGPKLDLANGASKFETGSHDYSAIYGFREALKLILEIGISEIERHIFYLTDLFIDGVKKMGFEIQTPEAHGERGGIVNMKVDDPEVQVKKLAKKNIIVSARMNGIRVSPTFYNNEEDINKLLRALRTL